MDLFIMKDQAHIRYIMMGYLMDIFEHGDRHIGVGPLHHSNGLGSALLFFIFLQNELSEKCRSASSLWETHSHKLRIFFMTVI